MINKNFYVYVVIHSESVYNRLGIFTGRVDSKLSERGHHDALHLAIKLKNKKIGMAFTSPLKRTRETLKYILKYHPETKVVVDNKLIERDYGILSRKNKEKYKKDYPDLYPIYHRSYKISPPKGESMMDVEKRILIFLKDMINLIKEKKVNVLIVTHGNAIRPIRKYFEGLSSKQMMELKNIKDRVFTYKI